MSLPLSVVRALVHQIKRCTSFGVRAMVKHGPDMLASTKNRNFQKRINRIFNHLANAEIAANEVLTEYIPVEIGRNPRRRRYALRRKAR